MLNMPYQGHINPPLGTVRVVSEVGYSATYVCDPRWWCQIEDSGALFIIYDDYPERPKRCRVFVAGFMR